MAYVVNYVAHSYATIVYSQYISFNHHLSLSPLLAFGYTLQTLSRGQTRPYRQQKKDILLKMSFFIKVAMTYSPTNVCSTIGAVGLNFSVRDGKRWIPDAINRLNKGIDALHIVQCKSIFFTSSVMETLFSFLSDCSVACMKQILKVWPKALTHGTSFEVRS